MTRMDLPIIGYFTWWAINGVKITRTELQKRITAAGIDYELPFPKIRSVFLKAVREVQKNQKKYGLLIRKIKKSPEEYTFGLVDERVYEVSRALSYQHQATLRFNTLSGVIKCDGAHRAFEAIKEQFNEFREALDSQDIRDIILELLYASHTVSVRQRGGVYFVPAAYSELLDKIEYLITHLLDSATDDRTESKAESYIAIAPLIDAEKSKNAIYKAFVDSLKYQMGKFSEALDKGIPRKFAGHKRLAEFNELRKHIEFYRDALQFQVDDLTKELDGLTSQVKRELSS
jgi:hypothetical protein